MFIAAMFDFFFNSGIVTYTIFKRKSQKKNSENGLNIKIWQTE